MRVGFVGITDGRGSNLVDTLRSAEAHLKYDWYKRYLFNDAADLEYGRWLTQTFPDYMKIHHYPRRGLGGMVKNVWTHAVALGWDYLWHAEDDMLYTSDIDVAHMIEIMEENPDLAQLALKRAAWSPEEISAGGFMNMAPDQYRQADGFISQQRLFTFNPCLIRREAMCQALDIAPVMLEREVTDTLVAQGWSFGYLGALDDPPVVTHTGNLRAPGWQL